MLDNYALQVFLEAARTENFTKAGQALNLSQSAVSLQIRSLEDYLQVTLFERNGRNVRLTKAGQALIPMAEQLVQMAVGVEESIRATGGKVVGNLTVGSSTASAKYVLPHLMARFQRLYPAVHVTIPVVSRAEMMEHVIAGDYDLGVTSLRVPGHDLHYTEFFTDRLELITSASHPWARRGSVEARELLDERFICREPESACRVTVDEGLSRLGVDVNQLDAVMEVGNPEALAMAVEHGIGISFVSVLAAMPRVALGRLAIVKVEGLTLHSPVEFVHNPSRPASLAQTKFLEFANHPQNRPLIDLLAEGRMT